MEDVIFGRVTAVPLPDHQLGAQLAVARADFRACRYSQLARRLPRLLAQATAGGEMNEQAMAFWNERAIPPIRSRTGAEIAHLLEGLELLEPGLVSLPQWRPDIGDTGGLPAEVPEYGAVARKP